MSQRRAVLACAGLATAISTSEGCATRPPLRTAAGEERVCFDKRDLTTIRALDGRHAFVKVSAGRFFMLTVDKTCQGLEVARSIAIVEATSRVCGDASSLVSFTDPVIGPMRCRIERVDSVADQNAALDLIQSRE
jgi:hypothetical protein